MKVCSGGALEKTVGDPPYANKAMALTGLLTDPCLGFAVWGRTQHWPYRVESDLMYLKMVVHHGKDLESSSAQPGVECQIRSQPATS